MYGYVKNITDIEYKDITINNFTYREIYIKNIYQTNTVFYATHLNDNCSRLLAMFHANHSYHIKNIDDFNKFMNNLDINLSIANQITDSLNWFYGNLKSKDNYKNITKEVFFKTKILKPYHWIYYTTIKNNCNAIQDELNKPRLRVNANEINSLIKTHFKHLFDRLDVPTKTAKGTLHEEQIHIHIYLN